MLVSLQVPTAVYLVKPNFLNRKAIRCNSVIHTKTGSDLGSSVKSKSFRTVHRQSNFVILARVCYTDLSSRSYGECSFQKMLSKFMCLHIKWAERGRRASPKIHAKCYLSSECRREHVYGETVEKLANGKNVEKRNKV